MRPIRLAAALALGVAGFGWLGPAGAHAQRDAKAAPKAAPKADAQAFDSLEDLNKHYAEALSDLDRRRMKDLTALAARLEGDEAAAAYQELFALAVTRDEYVPAEAGARQCLDGADDPRLAALASFVEIVAATQRDDNDQAIERLGAFLKRHSGGSKAGDATKDDDATKDGDESRDGDATQDGDAPKDDPNLVLAVGEAFLQRLVREGDFDFARKAARQLVEGTSNDSVQSHFRARLDRMEMIGESPPPIQGSDVDGDPASLADVQKGKKAVVVYFWASWAPTCVAELAHINALAARFGEKGFGAFGVNLDKAREGVKAEEAEKSVRQAMLSFNVGFPIAFSDGKGVAEDYHVTEVPSTFLIGPEGTITAVDLLGNELGKAVLDALGIDPSELAAPQQAAASAGTPPGSGGDPANVLPGAPGGSNPDAATPDRAQQRPGAGSPRGSNADASKPGTAAPNRPRPRPR